MIPEWFIIIPWYSSYYINKSWSIYSVASNRIRKPCINKKRWGYNYISLQEPWIKPKNWLLHRLVMLTFTGIKEWMEINHIDWNKSNNALSNLEWVTSSENKYHKYCVLWITHTDKQRETSRINWEKTWKQVWMYSKGWEFVMEFPSANKAWLFVWRTWTAINYCCKWVTKYSAGYIFKYL